MLPGPLSFIYPIY